ncbi:hypothetical protein IT570_06960 [Candidatus Sumerlaeota bacterium]|nr:hypothetical protein [Candidatus Sumerlaeota bacterium]
MVNSRSDRKLYAPDSGGAGGSDEDDYLSRLAKSVLGGGKRSAIPPPESPFANGVTRDPRTPASPGGGGVMRDPRTPASGRVAVAADPKTPAIATPTISNSPALAPPAPSHRSASVEVPPSLRRAAAAVGRDWIREVDMHDADGRLLPGTIFVLEDGAMGVYRERNDAKEYDVVYMLKPTGRAAPQGMPLGNYDVETVGRLTQGMLDQITSSGRWDRDMIVFHLLKFKDHVHVPEISVNAPVAPSEVPIPGTQEATVSSWTIKKPTSSDLHAPVEEKPALSRGREFTIQFGGAHQRWSAVYWGKDEMGHVVAHKTHEKWTLMHLDLNRFKETLQFGEVVGQGIISEMERDFAKK